MNTEITIIAILVALLCLICTGCYVLMLRRKLSRFTDEICSAINQMVSETDPVQLNIQESLFSRINHNLSRMHSIMQENRFQIAKEKQELQELVTDISHQVKTPLANLKMLNSTLERHDLSKEKQVELLHASDTQLEKLDFLMQAMVKTSRIETGLIVLSPTPAPIYETIAMALGGIVLSAEKKGIAVDVCCDETFMVHHDKKWTAEAIFNILDNAVKYTPDNGCIHVMVEKWEMYTKIEIIDNGKGIEEKHHAEIWKRFYREEDVAQTDGIGIGLYIARTVITMQNGYIKVKSAPQEGSAFSIFLLNS